MPTVNENKVKFGLKNVHAALVTETRDDAGNITYTYGTPKRWPGAVNLSLDVQGGLNPFYADDSKYYSTYSHTGYEGDFECAEIPEWVLTDIFGDEKDDNGVLIESNIKQPKPFALLFEFDGDQRATRHVLYYCMVSRPSLAGQTKEDTAEPQTSTATISASPRQDGSVHARVTHETDAATYDGWYAAVYEKTVNSSTP